MFHLELRQFPHVARVFNLSREELDARFARPWVSGAVIEQEEHKWAPDRARLTIYEGPELRPDEIGMGRGWSTVGKTSREVTETVLAEAQRGAEARSSITTFKAMLLTAAVTPMTFGEVVELASREYPLWRTSERLALAEQAIWEMLHQESLTLGGIDGPLARERWQPIMLSWSTWIDAGADPLLLAAVTGA
jgi:hypothetical protein